MKTYTVSVTRVSYSSKDFKVEAKTEEEAEAKAIELACNYDFGTGKSAEYEVENCTENS